MAIYVGSQRVDAAFVENKELYDPSAAELNKRHSASANAIVASNKMVITGYIDITEIMKHDEPKLEIYLNSDCFYSAGGRVTYYDANKTYLTTGSGGNWTSTGSFTTTWLDTYHAMLYLGVVNNAKTDFYDDIVYVRIEVVVYNNPAVESDRNVFLSITDPEGAKVYYYSNN